MLRVSVDIAVHLVPHVVCELCQCIVAYVLLVKGNIYVI